MAISLSDISRGTALDINGEVYSVTEAQHVKPGKGAAFLKIKMRNIKTGQVLERTVHPGEKYEEAHLDERKLQYLYHNGDAYQFMDMSSFEEISVSAKVLGDAVNFLQDNAEVVAIVYNNKILCVTLPTFIETEVTHTEPGFRGDTANAGTKPATIDTGAVVQVPLFVNIGEKIKIDTRTGTYVERVKK